MRNKYSDLFFIGLVLIILSSFFSLVNIKIKEGPGLNTVMTMKTSLGKTGISGKFDMKSPIIDSDRQEYDEFDDIYRELNITKKYASFPRFFRINFFIIMILSFWGLLVFAGQSKMRVSNKKGIFFGIVLSLALFSAVLFYEVNHYKPILEDFTNINIKDYYNIGFGPGFYILIVALLMTGFGTFFDQIPGKSKE